MCQKFWCDFSWPSVTRISIKRLNKHSFLKNLCPYEQFAESNEHYFAESNEQVSKLCQQYELFSCLLICWYDLTHHVVYANKCNAALGNVMIL